MTEETRTTGQEPKRPGIWSAIAYFAGVATLVAGILFVAGPDATDTVAAPTPETTTTTSTTVDNDVVVDTPTYVSGEEPIADAAEIILPSVVRIDMEGGEVGSGVIYDSDGLIITAAHVVSDRQTVRIRFQDGEQVTGTVLGAASDVDIAVIEVDKTGLPAAEFTIEKPRVGQMAIAVGSPWGLQSTVTAGIISAVDQTANCEVSTGCASLVQTDAAINPGNSGGALVDRQGRVVGINVSIFTSSGANDGVGFAVPSEIALEYAESIVSGEPIETAFLGVQGGQAEGDRAGALITQVLPDTAASEAGIQVDDVIIFFDGVEIQSILDLQAQVRAHQPGETVELILIRNGEELTLEVTLGERDDDVS